MDPAVCGIHRETEAGWDLQGDSEKNTVETTVLPAG